MREESRGLYPIVPCFSRDSFAVPRLRIWMCEESIILFLYSSTWYVLTAVAYTQDGYSKILLLSLCLGCVKRTSYQVRGKYFIKSWKTSAVSTTVWMVETQLRKLRGTSHTFVGRVYFILRSISFIIWFLWTKPTIWLLILSFTEGRSRVFYVLSLWRI